MSSDKPQYADGGDISSADFDPDAYLAEMSAQPTIESPTLPSDSLAQSTEEFNPDEYLAELKEEKYGTLPEMAKTAVEGLGKGLAGPLMPLAERAIGIDPEDIRAREEVNPVTAGLTEAVGLGAGLLTGTGEAGLMLKAGKVAETAAGLGKVSQAAEILNAAKLAEKAGDLAKATELKAAYELVKPTLVEKVGSAAVKNAVETAVMQSADEVSKMVLGDINTQNPGAAAQTALLNIGLAGALGGAAGGAWAGTVSPLWDAAIGPQLDGFLGTTKKYLNGEMQAVLKEESEAAVKTLGDLAEKEAKAVGEVVERFDVPVELRAAMSGHPEHVQLFNELREAQVPEVINSITKLQKDVDDIIQKQVKVSPDDIVNYSKAEGGKQAMKDFASEYRTIAKPITAEFNALKDKFKTIPVNDKTWFNLADKVTELAQREGYLGSDIPQDKLVQAILTRIPGIKSVDDMTRLNTIVNNIAGKDLVLQKAGRQFKNIILEAQQDALGNIIQSNAPQLFERYTAVRGKYAELAKLSEQLADELGLSKFVGPESLLARMAEKRSPEQFLSRLSPKGNAAVIDLLSSNFPKTLESIRQNELREILKPAVMAAKEGHAFNINKLGKAIEQGLAGSPERIKFAMSKDALDAIQAGKKLIDSIPGIKSSGTAGWQQKMMQYVPQSAMGLAAMMATNSPFAGALGFMGGHIMKLVARDVPDAIKLSMLRFLASEQPVKAAGFKSMVEYMHAVSKGETMLNKATTNLFKSSGIVLASNLVPSVTENDKLDKIVDKYKENPDEFMKLTSSEIGHYMPEHQQAMTANLISRLNYLAQQKPMPYKNSPLDREVMPTKAQESRYQSALTIANQPLVILEKAKNGTLKPSDIQDIQALAPDLYNKLIQQISDKMINHKAEEEPIPYNTRMGLSLLLGQPVDSTMKPESIIAAQPKPTQQSQPQAQGSVKKGTSTLGKNNRSYMTPEQASESRKINNK